MRLSPNYSNSLYKSVLNRMVKITFPFWQRLGLHVSLNHFYWPIPDTNELEKYPWEKKSDLPGINLGEGDQLTLLQSFKNRYKSEYETFPIGPTEKEYEYFRGNTEFKTVDAEILYAMIRHFKPGKMVEIGSGFSTCLAAQAMLANKKEDPSYPGKLISIEPYPRKMLLDGFPGLSELMIQKVQAVPLSFFESLGENDILFIDSSHVLKTGSDVQYEFLEILPRLKKGVIVHIHDIFLPFDYPKEWVIKHYRFYNEQYLLQAFLQFNEGYKILWAGCYMSHTHPKELQAAFNNYNPSSVLPGSFWIQRT